MKLTGARVATGPHTTEFRDLQLHEDNIEIDLSGHLLLPGLINAHDHLEFNLFPQLGRRIYQNAAEWADDVYRPNESPVREHLAVPKPARLLWGAIKNLVSGVTTVTHHNPYDAELFEDGFPVHVVRQFGWAHSLDFSPDLQDRFRQTPNDWPFIVHAAEGTDAMARFEIKRLDELGILSSRTVLVHTNAAGPGEIELIRARGCSVVWCPSSNIATYGQTLSPASLRGIPVALGTDSAMTAGADLLDEIGIAREHGVSGDEIYRMVTSGSSPGDLVVVTDVGQTPAEAIFRLNHEMVIVGGEIKLISRRLADKVPRPFDSFHPISVEGRGNWLIDVNMPDLIRQTTAAIGPDVRLAGRLVS